MIEARLKHLEGTVSALFADVFPHGLLDENGQKIQPVWSDDDNIDWQLWFREQCIKFGTPIEEQSPEIVDIMLSIEGHIDAMLTERERE